MGTPKIWLGKKINRLGGLKRYLEDTHHTFIPTTNCDKLNDRFCLSYRDVEELLFARKVIVTYEAIRQWCRKFGQAYANQLRRRRPRPGDKWHLDEVFSPSRADVITCSGP
jgi:hypothetical protein